MGIHAARQHVSPGGVDHAVRVDVEAFSDERDSLALDVHVADVVVSRGDDPTALDQNRHAISPFHGNLG